jgi:hypothetical protein
MTQKNIIIEKKKTSNILKLLFVLIVFIVLTGLCITGLISEEKNFLIFIFFLPLLLFIRIIINLKAILKKLRSKNPEFELTENELIIYDNQEYNRIFYSEMIECKVYRYQYSVLLGIILKPESLIRSNITKRQSFVFNIPIEKSKIVFVNLEFSSISPDRLRNIITERIIN